MNIEDQVRRLAERVEALERRADAADRSFRQHVERHLRDLASADEAQRIADDTVRDVSRAPTPNEEALRDVQERLRAEGHCAAIYIDAWGEEVICILPAPCERHPSPNHEGGDADDGRGDEAPTYTDVAPGAGVEQDAPAPEASDGDLVTWCGGCRRAFVVDQWPDFNGEDRCPLCGGYGVLMESFTLRVRAPTIEPPPAEFERVGVESRHGLLYSLAGERSTPEAWDRARPESGPHIPLVREPEALDRIRALEEALHHLIIMARTSGGTAGPDAKLTEACDEAERVIIPQPEEAP